MIHLYETTVQEPVVTYLFLIPNNKREDVTGFTLKKIESVFGFCMLHLDLYVWWPTFQAILILNFSRE